MSSKQSNLGAWVSGANSLLHPSSIPQTAYHWAENVINRGGVVQTRPGLKLIHNVPGTKLQGMTTFAPDNQLPYLVFAIDGIVYVSQYPFDEPDPAAGDQSARTVWDFIPEYHALPNIVLNAVAEQVTWCVCLQSVRRNVMGNLEVITPRPILIIQDGTSRCAYWDGHNSGHFNPEPPDYGPPTGTWMAWVAARLWIARGSQVIVSDYANPTAFTENTYLAEKSNFQLPDECTGLLITADFKNLLAFTRYSTTSFQASVRQRNLWQETPNFQQELIPNVGCVSGRSCINQYGTSWWYAENGWIDLNTALFSLRTSELVYRDNEMARSKRNISHNTESICTATYDNLMLVSVPSGSMDNQHTWVMDGSVIDEPGANTKAWAGVWTGIAPVEWGSLNISGMRKLYAGCQSETTLDGNTIQIWEAMQNRKLDNENSIASQFETRCEIPDGEFRKFAFIEIDIVEMLGNVNLKAFYAGIKGGYEPILDLDMQAQKGSVGSPTQLVITAETIFKSYRPQTRTVRSKQSNIADGSVNQTGCVDVESDFSVNIDKGFSILLEWRGQMGIRAIRLVTEDKPATNKMGTCEANESGVRILTERGESIQLA